MCIAFLSTLFTIHNISKHFIPSAPEQWIEHFLSMSEFHPCWCSMQNGAFFSFESIDSCEQSDGFSSSTTCSRNKCFPLKPNSLKFPPSGSMIHFMMTVNAYAQCFTTFPWENFSAIFTVSESMFDNALDAKAINDYQIITQICQYEDC